MKKINFRDDKVIDKIVPFVSVIIGLLLGFLLLLITGYPAVEGFKNLFLGGVKGLTDGNLRRTFDTFSQMTPLIFTGIAVAFAFRTGLFNIGAAGQFLVGGFVAVLLGNKLDLNPYIFPIVTVLGAAIAGGVWGSISGFLKAKYNIHEVVTSIMLNYTAVWLVQYSVVTYIPGKYETESSIIKENANLRADWLTKFSDGSSVSIALFIGIAVLILVYIILEKTTFGYELKAVGFNKSAAEYSGMKVNRNIVLSMFISGALAGMGGAAYYTGYMDHIKTGILLNYGFDGIAVSLLGLNSPMGVGLSALFFGYMKNGGNFMASSTSIPNEIVDIVIAIIIYCSAISVLTKKFIVKIIINCEKAWKWIKQRFVKSVEKEGGKK